MYRTIVNRDTLKDISMASKAVFAVYLCSFSAFAYLNGILFTLVIYAVQLAYSLLTILLILKADRLRRDMMERG